MGHTSGALRSRNFASSARGLRPDGEKRLDAGEVGEKTTANISAVLSKSDHDGATIDF